MTKPDGLYIEVWKDEKSISGHLDETVLQTMMEYFGDDFYKEIGLLYARLHEALMDELEKKDNG